MQQIKCIIMRSKSLPWPYAHIHALICAVNYVSGTQALRANSATSVFLLKGQFQYTLLEMDQ